MLPWISGCTEQRDGSPPEALIGLAWVDHDGDRMNPAQLAGQVVLVNFMFTRCPGPCPRLTKLLTEARQLLSSGAKHNVRFISITVDPEHDTPDVLHEFARAHSANHPGWRFVRTSPDELEKLARRLTVFDPGGPPAPSAHSMKLYLFDGQGRPMQRYDGNAISPDHLAREIEAAVSLLRSAS